MTPKRNETKLDRQNLLLSTIRNVHQLLLREKDRTRLLQGICDHLVANRGYYSAWIILLDKAAAFKTIVAAGLDEGFLVLTEGLRQGALPDCARQAASQSRTVIIKDPFAECLKCPLAENYSDRSGLSVRLAHAETLFGILTVSIARDLGEDQAEHQLLAAVAEDIALVLHNLDLEEDRKQAEADLKESLSELAERTKELNCLYSISRLIELRQRSLPEILQGTADIIASGWRYPEIACARILFDHQEFKTENFAETTWHQSSRLIVRDKPAGLLEVGYLEDRPSADEGPFLNEERSLIDAIAERLGKMIERRQAEAALQESEKRFRDLVENSLAGISIVQGNQVIYQNQEQERLFGSLPRSSVLGNFENIHPDDVAEVRRLSQDISAGKVRKTDLNFRLFSGDTVDGKRDMKWVYCRAIRIEYQGMDAILVNMIDVSKTKELEQLLILQDKMASLGRVAAGIAHEIRNPLSGINIYLNTLEKIYDKTENQAKVQQIMGQLKSASSKIESVIRRVMDFSKPGEPRLAFIDINQPVTDALHLTAVTLRKNGITAEKNLAEDLPACSADPNLIEVMVLNLINNAADAMRGQQASKRIRVTTSQEGRRILIRVSDSGPGVPPDIHDKIFDPFFTTKSDSTGIGLSLCHRIANDHRGTIQVADSELGGAEFRIEIPLSTGNQTPGTSP